MSKMKRMLALLLSVLLVFTFVPWSNTMEVNAASKPKLAKKTATIYVGKTTKIKVKNKPKGAKITYKSLNKKVATVNKKGKVKGKKSGKTNIRVLIKKKGRTVKKLYFKVTVKKKKSNTSTETTQSTPTEMTPSTPTETTPSTPTPAPSGNSGSTTNPSGGLSGAGYEVMFNSNGGNSVSSQNVKNGEMVKEPENPVRDKYVFDGWYSDESLSERFDFSKTIDSNITLYAKWIEDVDNDKVGDVIETILGSSSDKDDTDDDGISDYLEIYEIGSDPIVADSDSDTDGDGLSNIDEVKLYGTHGGKKDSDGDGLTDYEEIITYMTNPLSVDTDNDGIEDRDEILIGSDPLKKNNLKETRQTIDDKVLDEELISENSAIPSVSGYADYIISDEVSITKSANTAVQDNRAVVGQGVDIDVPDGSELSISFELAEEIKSPVIMKLGNEGWDLQESKVEDQRISSNLVGDGTYCVMDLDVLLPMLGIDVTSYYDDILGSSAIRMKSVSKGTKQAVEENDLTGEVKLSKNSKKILSRKIKASGLTETSTGVSGQADIIFAIDTTGSMSDVISNVANNIIGFSENLMSSYNVNVNYALVDYKDIEEDGEDTTKNVKNGTSNWFTDVRSFQNAVSELTVDGGGDVPETAIDALEFSRRLNFRSNVNKYIVLVTDADYKNNNNYGINSMDEEISLLKNNEIVVSVVTNSDNQEVYQNLYENTGGFYANINGNFSEELMRIADMIGESVNSGNWILLDDYQYISLEEPLDEIGVDTDKDGISDFDELKSPVQKDATALLKLYLLYHGVPAELIDEYFMSDDGVHITLYPYNSNPAVKDTDYDGVNDKVDKDPKNGKNTGQLIGYENINEAYYQLDFRNFFSSNKSYNGKLARASLIFANTIYSDCGFKYSDGGEFTDITKLLEYHGFDKDTIKDYRLSDDYNDDDISEIAIGYHDVTYGGQSRRVIAVVIRGTNGTIEEWSSNFDMGDPDEWDSENHKGFYTTEERIKSYVLDYAEKVNKESSTECVYWITGHSRGAALANLLAAQLVDKGNTVYAYTFATPSTTVSSSKNDAKYGCIFNFANTSDVVTCVPLQQWNFGRYGITKDISIEDSGLGNVWSSQTNHGEYNALNKSLINVALNRIYNSCSKSWAEVFDRAGAQLIGDEKYNCITSREFRYCDVNDIQLLGHHTGYSLYPSTAFVFQLGAEFLGGDQSAKDNAWVLVKELWNSKYGAVALLLLGDVVSDVRSSSDHAPKELGESLVGDGHAPATYYVLLDAVR